MPEYQSSSASHLINCVAPIRICDNGGWTDTWFAEHGVIFNIGVYPYAEVQITARPYDGNSERIVIHAENYGERFSVRGHNYIDSRHPLLEAAVEFMKVPDDLGIEVTIFSEAPAGASTGTSAAVTVALIGALDCLTPGRMTPHEAALAAQHRTNMLGQQCGIQDQICSAYGGINLSKCFVSMPRFHRFRWPMRYGGNLSAGWCWFIWASRTNPRLCTRK